MSTELQEIEMSIEDCRKKIELKTLLEKLQNNEAWKKLIEEHYLEKYASRLVRLKAAQGLQDEINQRHISSQIDGIGFFNQFLHYVMIEGNMAQNALEDNETAREEILREVQ